MIKCPPTSSGCASRCVKIGLLALVGTAIVTGAVMLLWNSLLPDLFSGVRPIGYWQALGLLVLCRILFGGMRGGFHGHWRERRAQWESMTPEERQQLKGQFRSRWGRCCSSNSTDNGAVSDDSASDQPAARH